MANVTDSDCSICIEPLANKSDLAGLFCGHVFHNECISKWTATRPTCPLCQKNIHHYQFPVIRLYLGDDSTNDASNTREPNEQYEKLKKSYLELNNKMAILERKYAQKKKKLEQSEQQMKTCEQQAKIATKQIDAYKIMTGVFEMEARLNTSDRQAQMRTWSTLDKDNLIVLAATLNERLLSVTANLENTDKQLKRAYDRVHTLKSRYRKSLEVMPKRTASPASDLSDQRKRQRFFNPDELLRSKKQAKQPAIQLDSDEELTDDVDNVDDPDDMFWIPPTNTNIEESDLVAGNNQNDQPSSSSSSSFSSSSVNNTSTTDLKQSRQRLSEVEKKLVRKKKLQQMGIYGNGILPPVVMNTMDDDNRNNNNGSSSSSNNNHDNIVVDDEAMAYDDDDGYVSPSSPLPPIRIVSPVRNITLPKMAILSRVIELSSDEENQNYT